MCILEPVPSQLLFKIVSLSVKGVPDPEELVTSLISLTLMEFRVLEQPVLSMSKMALITSVG